MNLDEKIELLKKRNEYLWDFNFPELEKIHFKFVLKNDTGGSDLTHPLRMISHDREDIFNWLYTQSINSKEWIASDEIYNAALSNNCIWLTKKLQKLHLLKDRTHLPLFQSISFLQGFNPLGSGMVLNNDKLKKKLIKNLKYLIKLPFFEDEAMSTNNEQESEHLGLGLGHNLLSYAIFTNAYYLYDILWDKTFNKGEVFLWNLPMLNESLTKLYLHAHESFYVGEDNVTSKKYWDIFEKNYPETAQSIIEFSKDYKYIKVEGPMIADKEEDSLPDNIVETLKGSRGWEN